MSDLTQTRKCGRCLALESLLGEFELSEMEVQTLKSGQKAAIVIDQALYERMRALLEK